jgi:hypothetical protein
MGCNNIGNGYLVCLREQPNEKECWLGYIENSEFSKKYYEELICSVDFQKRHKFKFYVNYIKSNWKEQIYYLNNMVKIIVKIFKLRKK